MLRGLKLVIVSVTVIAITIGLAYVLGGEAGQYIAQYRAEREYLQQRDKDSEQQLANANRTIIGEKLPEDEFKDVSGNTVRLSELLRRKTVVSFMSSNCQGCMTQAEQIASLARDSVDFAGFIVISLSDVDDLISFKREYGLKCPVLHENGEYVMRFFNNYLTPTSLIVNRDGVVEKLIAGHLTDSEIEDVMDCNRDS